MAKFIGNNLRPEENYGGFEPTQEEEVFLLENLPSYPGKLPYVVEEIEILVDVKQDEELEEPVEVDPAVHPVEEPVPMQTGAVAAVEGLDEEFLSMLKQDLEKSEERKLHSAGPPEAEESLPIDEADDVQLIDLTALNTEEDAAPPQKPRQRRADITPPAERRRPKFVWLVAAGLFFFALAGGSGFMYWRSLQPAAETAQEATKPEVRQQKEVKPQHQITVTQTQPLETPAVGIQPVETVAEPLVAPKPEKPAADSAAPKVAAVQVKPAIRSGGTPVRQPAHQTQPQMKRSIGEGLYVVQILATPSHDDAVEWRERLLSRNAENPTVTPQKIRGQEFYRVRFGAFKSREEAEQAARRLGYAQSWVVQVH